MHVNGPLWLVYLSVAGLHLHSHLFIYYLPNAFIQRRQHIHLSTNLTQKMQALFLLKCASQDQDRYQLRTGQGER